MRRRKQNKKVDLSYSEEQQQEDSLNQHYVEQKRAKKKGTGGRGKQKRRHNPTNESDDNNERSQEIIQFKHNDGEVKQHFRPSFIQRWNGLDNELQIYSDQYAQMSPMFKIYWQTKSKNMNAVIFLQFGRVQYFAFENDAILLHQIFKKKLKHFSAFLMVNFWSKQIILAKQELFDRNIPVLMMNEINDREYKNVHGLIRRQIDEVLTPGIHLQMQDKAYKERWFMAFYIVDYKQMNQKKIHSRQNQQKNKQSQQAQLFKSCVVLLDSQTNKFYIEQFQVDQRLHDVRRVINRYRPVQLLIKKSNSQFVKNIKQISRQICNPYIVEIGYDRDNEKVNQTLQRFMKKSKAPIFKQLLSLAAKNKAFEDNFQMFASVRCLDLIYQYLSNLKLKEKIFDEGLFQISCFNQAKLKPFFDSQVYENLQVFRIKNEDESDGKKGTLISYLDLCNTNSGKKLLRRWINQPLITKQAIMQRQQCIRQIVENQEFGSIIALHQKLIAYEKLQKQIADVYHWIVKGYQKRIHKLTGDLNFQKGYDQKKNPAIARIKQILKILNKLNQFQEFLGQLKKFQIKSKYFQKFTKIATLTLNSAKKIQSGQKQLSQFPQVKKIISSITQKIDYNEATDFLEPVQGAIKQYDEQKKIKTQIQQKLQNQLDKWKKHFNNNKITFAHVKARNQIQIPKGCLKSRKDKPKQFVFSSQTANTERFTTAKTIQLSDELMIHENRIARLYEPFLNDIVESFCQYKFIWNKYVQAISELDVLFSISQVCKRMVPRCLPKFTNDDQNSCLQIKKGNHPGLLQVLQPQELVSNNLKMKNLERFLLLTGPNMGGKSTLLRQTCLLAILAQIGSYVPCQKYESIVFDQIFCRIGASDRIIEGKSTFYVQLEQTHRILKQATSSSLVIIDELGRGTSTYDGMAIAEATIQYILDKIGCYSLFSTHYTSITRDFLSHEEVKCSKMSYKLLQKPNNQQKGRKSQIGEQKLQFLYQVQPGVAQKSFANNVARMVGLPNTILVKADQKASWISQMHQEAQKKWKITKNLNNLVQAGIIDQKQPSKDQIQI